MSPEGRPAPFSPAENRQLFRFCLYGFLKNQQYYEPFFMLALLAKGLTFLDYGLLWGFSKITTSLLEIPTGAVADVCGRRRTMIASFSFYIAAFAVLAFTDSYWALFPAMSLFAAGEAFREGTHKAMIFDWLTRLGRGDEKTRVYGITRSWSKIGSALGVALAAVIVITWRDYRWVFVLTAIPFALNIVNFLFYPKYLDGEPGASGRKPVEIAKMLWSGLKLAFTKKQLRSLLVESMCFEGIFEVAKDYLQPLLQAVAVMALAAMSLEAEKGSMIGTALLAAAVGIPLAILSSLASRHSHRAASLCGGDDRLAAWLWIIALGLYVGTGAALVAGLGWLAIFGFVLMTAVQNVWRPTLTARYYSHAETQSAATTLSVESQAKGLTAALLAPVLGWVVDMLAHGYGKTAKTAPIEALWPVVALGAFFCLVGAIVHYRIHREHWHGPAAGAAAPAESDKKST